MTDPHLGAGHHDGPSLDAVASNVTQRLVQEFAGRVGLEVIDDAVRAAVELHADARRHARARLRDVTGPEDR